MLKVIKNNILLFFNNRPTTWNNFQRFVGVQRPRHFLLRRRHHQVQPRRWVPTVSDGLLRSKGSWRIALSDPIHPTFRRTHPSCRGHQHRRPPLDRRYRRRIRHSCRIQILERIQRIRWSSSVIVHPPPAELLLRNSSELEQLLRRRQPLRSPEERRAGKESTKVFVLPQIFDVRRTSRRSKFPERFQKPFLNILISKTAWKSYRPFYGLISFFETQGFSLKFFEKNVR